MKKALVILLALTMVIGVFAEEPKPELKVSEFKGDAAVLFGADLDEGAVAFGNTVSASLKLDLMGGGDKTTAGEGIWGELKIKTDGDPIQVKADGSGSSLGGYKVVVDYAKLHLGPNAYIGIKSDGTAVDKVMEPDMAAPYFKVDNTQHYGQKTSTTLLSNEAGVGPNAPWGIVVGFSVPSIADITVDFRSFEELKTNGTLAAGRTALEKNAFGLRGNVSVTAVPDLTLELAGNTGFGGESAKYDMGFGAKAGYKIALSDPFYVKPTVGFNGSIDNAAGGAVSAAKGTGDFDYSAQAGVLLGWGAKAKAINTYFFNDSDTDWGYYPGVSAGVVITNYAGAKKGDMTMGLNVSTMTGSLVPNLTAAVACEIADLMADDLEMGIVAVLKYDVKMDPMTITPKLGINYYSDAAGINDEAKTDFYLKAGVDIAQIFPNCTLSFEYASNDFVGGVYDPATDTTNNKTMGQLYTQLKISF